jgi:hypothetical protein
MLPLGLVPWLSHAALQARVVREQPRRSAQAAADQQSLHVCPAPRTHKTPTPRSPCASVIGALSGFAPLAVLFRVGRYPRARPPARPLARPHTCPNLPRAARALLRNATWAAACGLLYLRRYWNSETQCDRARETDDGAFQRLEAVFGARCCFPRQHAALRSTPGVHARIGPPLPLSTEPQARPARAHASAVSATACELARGGGHIRPGCARSAGPAKGPAVVSVVRASYARNDGARMAGPAESGAAQQYLVRPISASCKAVIDREPQAETHTQALRPAPPRPVPPRPAPPRTNVGMRACVHGPCTGKKLHRSWTTVSHRHTIRTALHMGRA